MPSAYRVLKTVYKAVVPSRLQRMTWSHEYGLWRLVEPTKAFLRRWASHNEIYDSHYFKETVDAPMLHSADVLARYVVDIFAPSSVLDVGCGTGALLSRLTVEGVRCMGLEYADAAIEIAAARGVRVVKCDLEAGVTLNEHYDLVISTEVAEHLPESCADRFVGLLAGAADIVLMTAATPGQGGTDHVNEQPNEYWIAKFAGLGFDYDRTTTQHARAYWEKCGAAGFYSRNALVFRKRIGGEA